MLARIAYAARYVVCLSHLLRTTGPTGGVSLRTLFRLAAIDAAGY